MQKNGFIENVTRIIRGEEERQEEKAELFSYIVYDNKDEENTKILITVNSESGIEYIQCPNGNKINGNGKQKIGLDYIFDSKQECKFIIKEINKEEQEKKLYINNDIIENTAVKLNIEDIEGYTIFSFENIIKFDGYNKYYYRIGEKNTWVEGSQCYMFDYDVIQNGLANEDNTVTISAKIVNNTNGNEVIISKKIDVVEVQEEKEIQAESLIKAISEETIKTGKYNITVNDTTYNTKVYNIVGDTDIIMNATIGIPEDVGTASGYAQNMIILKVNGNLTIEQGKSFVPYGNAYGGPKGMFIYCTETLTNNGTISMTGRGAKAEGQNVYLWENGDGNYEYVPATGATGGTGGIGYGSDDARSGSAPSNAYSRMTGGGGGGAGQKGGSQGGTGGTGTSYSGGAGGGGSALGQWNSSANASNYGTSGGNGVSLRTFMDYRNGAGGGAGNPGGAGAADGRYGANGTGGLLIIYSKVFDNKLMLSSNGASGGSAYRAGGGGSGGGSINIFYNEMKSKGTIQVNGGAGGIGTRGGSERANGANGGNGTVTFGNISTGTFTKD